LALEDQNGHSEQPTGDDRWPLDHHIEEMLGAFSDAARPCDCGVDDREQESE
jgi:hypothetical protein